MLNKLGKYRMGGSLKSCNLPSYLMLLFYRLKKKEKTKLKKKETLSIFVCEKHLRMEINSHYSNNLFSQFGLCKQNVIVEEELS